MARQHTGMGGLAFAALVASIAFAPAALAQAPSFQVTSQDANSVEIRFHGVPLRAVHADDSQNALSLDFQTPVDGATFDRLPGAVPQWINMAYANFDNGIIRSPRPVTFLTRAEPDGFSLRIVARGAAPPPAMAQNAPPPQMRGQYDAYGPPPPQPYGPPPMPYGATPITASFRDYGAYDGLRSYAAQQLSVRRGDPIWELVYGRAAMRTDSGLTLRNDANWYDGGDRMLASRLSGKYTLLPGIALVGNVRYTAVQGTYVPASSGTSLRGKTDLVTGHGGLAFELGRDTELKLEASEGNNITGGKASLFAGDASRYLAITGDYHTPYLDTPTAVANLADRDQVTLAGGTQLGWGLWASAAGHFTNYGIHGDSHVASTAGWDGNLRWTTQLPWGLLGGLSYDGFGEYRVRTDAYPGPSSTTFTPLGIRNIENHAVTASLSTALWENLWFNAYGGYVKDRFGSDGLLAGLDLHFTPVPGWDLALGVRQSAVSYTQGETGNQTTAGLNLTMGFGAPPQPSWMLNSL